MKDPDDFYEEDEDPEDVHAAFEGGEHGLTSQVWSTPVWTWTSGTTWTQTWPNGGEPGGTR